MIVCFQTRQSQATKSPNMDKLNEHDKDTVFNCVKNHIEKRRDKNYQLIKEKGIGPSKTSPWLYRENNRLNKDLKNWDIAIKQEERMNEFLKPD